MMKWNSKNLKYTNRFHYQVMTFIQSNQLFERNDEIYVGLSGGIDSMALLYFLTRLNNYGYSLRLKAIHINHGTRSENNNEQIFVNEFCKQLGVDCYNYKIDNLKVDQNFENNARVERYNAFYKSVTNKKAKIALAHHIDDSFEWSLLQSLRSSHLEGSIGIPVKNGQIIRPFMSVTKNHIEKYVHCFDLPFIEDPSNEDNRFERNYLRNEVVPAFSIRHPKYLKHYVHRQNELSRRLGLHITKKNKCHFKLSCSKDFSLIYNISQISDYSGLENLILEGVKRLNITQRGNIQDQLGQIIKALQNHKYGPIMLTKSIGAYLDYDSILLTRLSPPENYTLVDVHLEMTYDQFFLHLLDRLNDSKSHSLFPYFYIILNGRLDKRRFETTFNNRQLETLKQSGKVYYSAFKLLREWSKKRNRHKVLKLKYFKLV